MILNFEVYKQESSTEQNVNLSNSLTDENLFNDMKQ
jgi:hypothetical protein